MLDNNDADLTLPSVVTSLSGKCRDQALVLTVIFHPRTSLIGHAAVVPGHAGSKPWVVGRRSPAFAGRGGADPRPLEDPHVSRQALEFLHGGEQLVIRRFGASSRCRVAGCELEDSVALDREQLRAGVPMMLGHAVVLLLRLAPSNHYDPVEPACEYQLKGNSDYMNGLREQVVQASASDLDVLIRGETGTGKELVAAAIHSASQRAAAPLVSVNMAAIPAELAAAALFGSVRGAFTGANRSSPGYFKQAQGGSLFLDEIGDTSAEIQPQLLRALQQREIQAVGGDIRRVDVRVISATDAPLHGEGCDFKAALRHRLGACEILLLPLREHPEDIGVLLLHFLIISAARAGRGGLLPQEDSAAREIAAWAGLFYSFLNYHWPGNVRELANFAQQVILASEHQLTLADNVESALADAAGSRREGQGNQSRRKMQDVEEAEFDSAFQACGFEVARVARKLGVSRSSVYRRIGDSPRHWLADEVPFDELRRVLAEHKGSCAAAAEQLRVSLASLRARLRKLKLEWH